MLTVEQATLASARTVAHRHWQWTPPVILMAVGLGTGAVRVSYTAWLLAPVVLAWLAYGCWILRIEHGPELDVVDHVRPHLLVLTLGMALALVLIPMLNAPPRRPALDEGPVFLWLYVPMITWTVWAVGVPHSSRAVHRSSSSTYVGALGSICRSG